MQNVLNILKWESEKNMQILRQPVDKEKWTTEPAVVNAFYNPNKNDIGKHTSDYYFNQICLTIWWIFIIFRSVSSWDFTAFVL